MEFSYAKNLGIGRTIRYDPLIFITLVGKQEVDIYSLIDSGSPSNLFSMDYAEKAGIDLSNTRKVEIHGINGKQNGYLKKVTMKFLGKRWRSEVIFCDRNEDHDLLGSQGFFQHFEVRFRYYERKFSISPAPSLYWKK